MNPAVSVIIPTYNCATYVGDSIESALHQTYKDREIIVIDDGSTDNTREIVKQYERKIKYVFQNNKGSASARNQAIKLSQGELIAFLDSDDSWLPHKLETQVNYMFDHPDVSLVHSNISFVKDGQIIRHKLNIGERHKGLSIFEELYLGNFINTSTVVLRRDCLNSVGLLDEELRQAQDYDLWLRIAAKFNIGYQDTVTAVYRIHNTNISKNTVRGTAHVLQILKKIDGMYPELVNGIDKRRREDRHFRLNYSLGYGYFCQYDLSKARKYFMDALKYKKTCMPLYGYILSTFTNENIIDQVRKLKRKIAFSQEKSEAAK